ncbi:MAG: 3-phosphoshikimate 1-carboxyvinyltransferase [Candidatus Omnitrophota bacterium]
MTSIKITKLPHLKKKIVLPGDKSISHRAVMIASIAEGTTLVNNFLNADDCIHTIQAFEKMGVTIDQLSHNQLLINGVGLNGLKKPDSEIYLGNSGTSTRLLLGILAGQPFEASLTGDESLCKRPMGRVTRPLRMMGAKIEGQDDANFAPLKIQGGKLNSIDFVSNVSSAQVKSCIMLASLYADKASTITEPQKSRDHTERMLKIFNAQVRINGNSISVKKDGPILSPGEVNIPSDISSAAFFIALGLLLPRTELILKSCGINPTRIGFIEILKKMGANIEMTNTQGAHFEPYADIVAKSSQLKAIVIEPEQIPKMIDEVPIFTLVAAFAHGETVIKGLGELRVKETDRIKSMVTNLKAMGVDISSNGDVIIIKGPTRLNAARVNSFGDHRTAMTMIIAGCLCDAETIVEDTDCINTSFPGFVELIEKLR